MQYSNTGVFHLFIFEKIKEKNPNLLNKVIRRDEALKVLWHYNIPKVCRHKFLEEMQHFGLIRLKDKQNIELLR